MRKNLAYSSQQNTGFDIAWQYFTLSMCIQTNLNLNENILYIWYIFSFEKTALIVTIQKCSNLPASDAVNNLRWHFDLQQLDSGTWVRSEECSVLSSVTLWCHSLTCAISD